MCHSWSWTNRRCQESRREREDLPPGVFSFDFESPIDVPAAPISLSREEAERLDDAVKERMWIIRRAVIAYNEELGAYPPRADQMS